LKTVLRHNPVRTGRIFFILLLATFLVGTDVTHSQQLADVQLAVRGTITTKPGSIIAVGMKVTNRGGGSSSYQSKISLPVGWRAVTRDFPFTLQPGSSDIRLISFTIPPDAPAQQYQIEYSILDTAGHAGGTSFQVIVLPVVQLELVVFDAPRFVVGGAKFTTTFLLTNKGNSATSIRLRTRSSTDFPIMIDSTVQHFGPREVRQIKVNVATDAKSGRTSHTLEMEAISGQDSTINVRASSVVDVVSRATKVEDEYFNYPVTLSLREVGQDGLFATQAEAFGSGSLSEQHTDRLEFLFRGPETQTKSVLGQRDEYRIAYHSKSFEVYGGDLNYSLSPLTEFGRYTTGAGGQATVGPLTAGGFYNKNRWSTQSQEETAGFLSYDVVKGASIGLNYLQKRDQFNSDITSARGLFVPVSGSTLDLEYGTGTRDGKRDDAYSARLNGSQPWIGYDVRYVHAGPNFGGYYQDISFLSASINLQASRNVRIETYARQETRNLARDTNQVYVPNDQSYQVGAAYSDFVSVYLLRNIHQDNFDNPKYRREQDAIQGRLGYNFRNANIYVNGDYGSTRDELLNQSFPYKRVALNVGYRPIGNQNYSASIEYTNGQDAYTSENQERISASLNAWFLFGQSTQVQLDLYTSRLNVSPTQTYNLIEASVEHIFPFGHKIAFRARESIINPSSSVNQIAYALNYSIPIAIPVKRITAVGQLRGTVKDERGKGLVDVLIGAEDDAALTNNKGEYFFASLKPGSVFVNIDRASIGLERITTQSMPMEVKILGGEETELDLGVTRSVLISGTVIQYGSKDQALGDTTSSSINLGGKPGVFLELSNGADYNRRVTDNHGRFSFADIRPGKWSLTVIGGDVPEYHVILPDTTAIDAQPGDKKEITIEIRPKRRAIKILQEGTIIPQVPAKPEKKVELPPPTKQTVLPCIVWYDIHRKGYVLQISSWVTKSKALRVAKIAERISGLKSHTITVKLPSLGKRTRVFLGVFKTQKSAEEMCLKLQDNM
jgi:hypothetical protein